MYESTQHLIGYVVLCSLISAVGAGIAALFSDPRMETPRDDKNGTRIGNNNDQSRAAIEARARLAAGWFADGSCDYCSPPRSITPTTKPATAENSGPTF